MPTISLREQLEADFKSALKDKNELKLSVVRMLKAAIMNAEIALGGKGSFGDEQIVGVIRKEAKKRIDSIAAYKLGGRLDLAEKEKEELSILQNYLPQMMPEEEVRGLVQKVIADLSASGPSDFGKVMKEAIARAQGRAEGKMISEVVKKMLTA